jgi:Fic family protein
MLYLSLYLKQHRARYYELLDRVRREGDWEAWVDFFVQGVAETAEGAVATARRLHEIAEQDRSAIERLGREAGSAAVIHQSLQRIPVGTIAHLSNTTKLTLPTVTKALQVLARLGIVREITGRKRDRVYSYEGYMKVLGEGTEVP